MVKVIARNTRLSFFGERLFTELRKIKTAVDANNQLNPGKICTPLNTEAELVSVDAIKRGYYDRQIPVATRDSFRNAMDCNGNGLCFNYDTSAVMCPSYKVSGDRRYSPKGRASLMREWLRLTQQKKATMQRNPQQSHCRGRRKCSILRHRDDFSHEVRARWISA